jgi:DNA gyrase/topoisomerase IV subunit A
MLITQAGMIIRINVAGVRLVGRSAQGVKLMDLDPGDRLVAVAKLAEEAEPPEGDGDGGGPGGGRGPGDGGPRVEDLVAEMPGLAVEGEDALDAGDGEGGDEPSAKERGDDETVN